MKILTIIVTYNGMPWLDKCLSSIENSDEHSDIYVIDNCSTDNTVQHIKEHYPQVHLFRCNENLGFAKANNLGLRYALDNGYDFAFLLNQDAWVNNDTLTNLVRTFDDNQDIGIASPVHLNGISTTLDFGFASYMQRDFVMDLYMNALKRYYDVPFVNAAAWMLPRQSLEIVGGFDTLLFTHYEEDQNYCQRVRYHKLRIVINTSCTICHDREQRDEKNYEGRTIWQNENKDSFVKVDWGDINRNIDIKSKIKRNKIKILISKMCLKRSAAERFIDENKLLQLIEKSRNANVSRASTWL